MTFFTSGRRIDELGSELTQLRNRLVRAEESAHDLDKAIGSLQEHVGTLMEQMDALREAPRPEAILGAVTDLHVQATGIMDRLHALAARLAKARRPCDEPAEAEVERLENEPAPAGTSRSAYLARKEALRARLRNGAS